MSPFTQHIAIITSTAFMALVHEHFLISSLHTLTTQSTDGTFKNVTIDRHFKGKLFSLSFLSWTFGLEELDKLHGIPLESQPMWYSLKKISWEFLLPSSFP